MERRSKKHVTTFVANISIHLHAIFQKKLFITHLSGDRGIIEQCVQLERLLFVDTKQENDVQGGHG